MSSALLRKSLALCNPDLEQLNEEKVRKNNKRKDSKARVTHLNKYQKIETERKISVKEAREALKLKEQTLKDNLQRIKLSKKTCKVKLNKNITEQFIERALTRKPVKAKLEKQKVEETVFTEEDFQKFEAEYNDY